MNEEREKQPIYEKIQPKCSFDDIELKSSLKASLDEVLEDHQYAGILEDDGLVPRKLIILHGPPGCGKTSIAHAMAKAMSLPLYMVSGANLESCYVGESEKNAEEVFRFANKQECVMLIDEFDSFAINRNQQSQYGLKLVNTFLTNMETRPPEGLIIACTNFIDRIDPAILRRFDIQLEVPQLSTQAMVTIAEKFLKGRHGISPSECVQEGKTPSGTIRSAKNKLRTAIINEARARKATKGKKKKVEKEKELLPTAPNISTVMGVSWYDRSNPFLDRAP